MISLFIVLLLILLIEVAHIIKIDYLVRENLRNRRLLDAISRHITYQYGQMAELREKKKEKGANDGKSRP